MSSRTNTIIRLVVLFVLLLSSNNGVQSSKAHKEISDSGRSIAYNPANENQQNTNKAHDDSKIGINYQTGNATSTSMEETKSIIDSLTDDIMIKIFAYLTYSCVRQILTGVCKKWNRLAYSEILDPVHLKLVYDYRIPETSKKSKKLKLIQNPTQAVNFNAFKTLEIEVVGDMIFYNDLYNFVQDRVEKFEKLENLIIKMEWTRSNDKTLRLLKQLLRKSEALKKFSLKWFDTHSKRQREGVEFTKDDFKQNFEFWEELKNSKVEDVTFAISNDYYLDIRASLKRTPIVLRFYSYLFENAESAALKNLRKLAFNVPPSEKTYNFFKNLIENNFYTMEEINIDLNYFVHWMKEKNNLLKRLSNCPNLKKLAINIPISYFGMWNENTGENLEPRVWREIVDMVGNRRTDIFLELRTNAMFLLLYNNFEISNNELELNFWKSLKSLIVDLTSAYQRGMKEIAVVLERCPELEKLEITSNWQEDDFTLVEFIFYSASKLKNLKELAIACKIPEAQVEHGLLIKLVNSLKNINKITVTVTSWNFLEHWADVNAGKEGLFDPDISDEELAKQKKAKVSEHRDRLVGKYILNESEKEELRNSLHNLFEIESKFHTKLGKNDSTRLILTRK